MSKILYILGGLLTVLAAVETVPLIVDRVSGNPDWMVFAVSSLLTLFFGMALLLANSNHPERLTIREAYLLTAAAWLVLPIFGAVPFLFSGQGISITDAVFESVSGLTTTGSTVLSGLDELPPGLLLWRSMLQWSGGIGIIVMGVAILPLLSVGGMQLMKTENSDTSDKVLPRAKEIATGIGAVYVFLTLACAVAYGAAGMDPFDALNHAMTTIATGGFSTHDVSFSYFSAPALPWVAILFMLMGALPFVLYLKAIGRDPTLLFKNAQVRFFLGFCVLVVAILTLWAWRTTSLPLFDAFSQAAFNAVSIITTTGYVNADYTVWGSASVVFLIITFAGGCSGSTTGSVKIFRYQLMWSFLKSQVNRLIHPHGVFPVTYDGHEVSSEIVLSVTAFLALYLVSWFGLSVGLALTGLDFQTSVSAAATALTNVGPGLGAVGGLAGNFGELSGAAKWFLAGGMLLGRLELFILFVLGTRRFWRDF
ncbi:MAG: TrkH family potassium uptake protein [Rhodospirillaceae bacterium]|jgi:trk system potassium uptake protein TrkH|nr:TrkH family potassium uptake protein [Rhodospirillaceae bacterium]